MGSRGNSRRVDWLESSDMVEMEAGAPHLHLFSVAFVSPSMPNDNNANTLGMAPPMTFRRNQERRESPSNIRESESRRLIKRTTGNGSCVMATAGWMGVASGSPIPQPCQRKPYQEHAQAEEILALKGAIATLDDFLRETGLLPGMGLGSPHRRGTVGRGFERCASAP